MLSVLAFLVAVLLAAAVHAQEDRGPVPPRIRQAELHRAADLLLLRLVEALTPEQRGRMQGIYVAFDTGSRAPYSLAGCDDDGDYVIVLSDALLQLLDTVEQLALLDRSVTSDEHPPLLATYAHYVGSRLPQGSEWLEPPPGIFRQGAGTGEVGGSLARPLARAPRREQSVSRGELALEAAAGIIAHELAYAAHFVTCSHPTLGKEYGDTVWTASEQAVAWRRAIASYTAGRNAVAAHAATQWLTHASIPQEGYSTFLVFWTHVSRSLRHTIPHHLWLHSEPSQQIDEILEKPSARKQSSK